MTAVDRVDCERIDHQGFVPEIYAGLLLTSLYLMQIGPTIDNIGDDLEDVLALMLFVGAVVCLTGVALGTKLIFRRLKRRAGYIAQLFGLPLLIGALGWYTYASVSADQIVISALSGGLGLCIEIGLIRLFVDLVQDITTDHSAHGHN
jgi:hypothetical protein